LASVAITKNSTFLEKETETAHEIHIGVAIKTSWVLSCVSDYYKAHGVSNSFSDSF